LPIANFRLDEHAVRNSFQSAIGSRQLAIGRKTGTGAESATRAIQLPSLFFLARETRAESAAAREAGGGEGDWKTRCSGDPHHQVRATPAHPVRQITLTLTASPGVRGEGTGTRGHSPHCIDNPPNA